MKYNKDMRTGMILNEIINYPLMTAMGLSFIVFLLMPAAWQVSTTSVTFL